MKALWARIPVKFQKAIADFWTVFLAGIVGLTIVVPSSDYRDWLLAIGVAIGNVAVNALRRAVADSFVS